MKIQNIKINAYGKLHNEDIDLKDNINIIQGKNESGKSTLLKYIINSFYGTSKNKKGKDISDFDKFKPWEGEEFSGKLKYKLDNGKTYEIYREFNKKNPKIFNENSEDISKQFSIDKSRGNDFFYEQTKIDEELFLSTSAIMQQEIKIEKNKQTTLIQKIANMVGTGDDNGSYKRAIDRLNRRQLDEVGTERTREKPLNLVNSKIQEINSNIMQLENYENEQFKIINDKNELTKKIINNEIKYELLNEINKINNKKEIEKEKINLQEKIKNENEKKINSLKNDIEKINNEIKKEEKNIKEENKKNNKIIKTKMAIFFILIIILNIIQFVLVNNKLKSILIFSLSVVVFCTFVYISKRKNNIKSNESRMENNKELLINNLKNLETEKNIIEKNKIIQEQEIEKIKKDFNFKYNLEIEKIKNNYKNKIEEKELLNLINSEKNNNLIDNLQKNINNEKINLQTLEINKENIEKKLDIKARLEEELSILSEQYVNLQNLNSSMNLAKEALNISYQKMKESVTPKFTQDLSNTVSKITNRKIFKCKI